MDDRTFNTRLSELARAIDSLTQEDRERLSHMAEDTQRRHEEIKKAIQRRGQFLDSLNLALNYLLFDLEATKRENAVMRMRLSGLQGGGGGPARPSN